MHTSIGLAALLVSAGAQPAPLSVPEMAALLKVVDERQNSNGDYRSLIYMVQKERDKVDVAYQAEVLRRSKDQKFIILFLQPKTQQGQGYLRIDQNLWFYDPSVGRWERRTERERIGGTNSRRSDFDESRLALEYDPSWVGEGKLGKYDTFQLSLKGKEGLDLAFPIVKLWVDKNSKNILKREEYSLSGRLMRTSYYPKWSKIFSESKGTDVWFPQEIHFFDEIEKANATHIVIKSVDLKPLPENVFTKAWLEEKSR